MNIISHDEDGFYHISIWQGTEKWYFSQDVTIFRMKKGGVAFDVQDYFIDKTISDIKLAIRQYISGIALDPIPPADNVVQP